MYTVDNYHLHCESKKDTILLPITSPNADFKNSCTGNFISESATKSLLNIPTYLECIATLSCEILMSKNSDNLKHVL